MVMNHLAHILRDWGAFLVRLSRVDESSQSGTSFEKLKGNRILVHVNAGRLPKSALRYIVAHEIAHTLTKKHTKRFWKIVESIYPTFETGQSLLMKYGSELQREGKSLPD
jgi:predicted metal-dependent hydrolase